MAFVPPTFADHGKAVKDLFSKKYSFDRSITVKSTALNGTELETVGQALPTGYAGSAQAKYKNSDYGTWEAKFATSGTTTYSWESDKLQDGLKVKLSGNEKPAGAVDLTYKQDSTALTASVKSSGKATSVTAAAVVGFDGVSVGGEVVYDVSGQAVTDYNAAAQYTQLDFVAALKTANQADDIAVSYLHQCSKDCAFGGQLTYNIASGQRTITAGGEYRVDANVTVKGKANNAGTITTMVEHKLPRQVTFRLTTEFDANTHSTVPEKFGLGLIFGDN